MKKKVVVIGGGFGGLSAACYLARDGYDVTVLEKNMQVGGRAMVMKDGDFTFDLGPSWYMMPDVFEDFFADFGKKPSNYFDLVKLEPSYKIFFGNESFDVNTAPKVYDLFEKLEPGSSEKLKSLLSKTKYEYESVRKNLLEKSLSKPTEAIDRTALQMITRPELVGSYHRRVSRYFKDVRLQKILEFMVVFMGGSPKNIPALYSLLTHVDMGLGIWYPMGGMNKLVEAYVLLAKELGVKIHTDAEVIEIENQDSLASKVHTKSAIFEADIVVANADYHHVETVLLSEKKPHKKWHKMTMSPSGLLIYLGLDTKVPALQHHNLFFDVDWDAHFAEVFDEKVWSEEPLFYVGVPSVTDPAVAPKGKENIFVLAPMASGIEVNEKQQLKTVDKIIERLSKHTGIAIADHIEVKHVKSHQYFLDTFNAYKGNAFGPAHTLNQSAIFRPNMRSKQVKNVYYVGQYTNPGTGVPLVTISGKVVAGVIQKDMKK
jgi:phytoene desaturase